MRFSESAEHVALTAAQVHPEAGAFGILFA